MKRIPTIIVSVFILQSCAQNASTVSNEKDTSPVLGPSQDSVTEMEEKEIATELIKIEHDWANVLASHDWTMLERILAPDFVSVGLEEGKVNSNNKEQLIAKYKASPALSTKATLSEVKAEIHTRNMAVIRGYVTEAGKSKEGKEFSSVWYWVDSYIRRDGNWQCVVSFTSRVK
jgi:PBP1b-binding outer membrane lipoprotein LpoB